MMQAYICHAISQCHCRIGI